MYACFLPAPPHVRPRSPPGLEDGFSTVSLLFQGGRPRASKVGQLLHGFLGTHSPLFVLGKLLAVFGALFVLASFLPFCLCRPFAAVVVEAVV